MIDTGERRSAKRLFDAEREVIEDLEIVRRNA
jgi:hypothetical protein